MRFTERVRESAESLVNFGEKLLAVGRAGVPTAGRANAFAVAVTDARLAWADPWTGEPRGSVRLNGITLLRERDDGKDIRLTLRDGRELRLRFGGPTANALQALRELLTHKGVGIEVFYRDAAERERTRKAVRGVLARAAYGGWWRRYRFRRLHRL